MHLTQVAPTSSMVTRWRITRKPCSSSRADFRRRRHVASTSFGCGGRRGFGARVVEVAKRGRLVTPFPVCGLRQPDLGDSGYGVSGYAKVSHHLVSGDVVCDQPKERSQRTGFAAGPGTGQLSDGLVVAA